MKQFIAVLVFTICLFSCAKKEGNMIVQGQIKDLKKGKLYLQKMKDTLLVSVDSVSLNGSNTFRLSDNIKEPTLYYLTFDGNTTDQRILFFGEEGTITINDKVKNFGYTPSIEGSKNQLILDNYNSVKKKLQNERLDFIKRDFEAKKINNPELTEQIQKDYNRFLRKRILYTTNFIISNADTEVAPYIALTEMYDASMQMLDTVNNSLTPKVKASYYGKLYQEYLDKIKQKNNK
jgi:hypothetical protein